MTKTISDTLYTVRFTGDYFSMTVNVYATDEDNAEALAAELLRDEYGWNVADASHDIEVGEW
jgi:putative lipoic acid-binding regulatory protein